MGIYILDGICIIIKNGPSTNAWTVLVLWRLFRHCRFHNDGIGARSGHCECHNDGTRTQIPCRRLFSLHQFAVQRFEPRFDDFFTVTELVFIDDGFIFFKAFQQ